MTTILLFIFALAHAALVVWGLMSLRRTRLATMLMILPAIVILPYENAIIASGRWIGEGDLLRALSWPRFAAHLLLAPLWIIAAGSLARQAGLKWAQRRWAVVAFCVLATALIVAVNIPNLMQLQLHPACFAETLRYAETVTANQVCAPGQALARGGGPIAAIVAVVVVLIVAGLIWRATKWPWLFLGAAVLFVTSAIPPSAVGPAPGSLGEVVMGAAFIATALRFGRDAVSPRHIAPQPA